VPSPSEAADALPADIASAQFAAEALVLRRLVDKMKNPYTDMATVEML
jgi:hypothetical protein